MIAEQKVLAFIGARSGSKGLVDKNIKIFSGKPLMAWAIEAALASKYVDTVIVSTDSQKYAEIAKQYGALVMMRPSDLATDNADIMAALTYTYQHMIEQYGEFDLVVKLQPTSPFNSTLHIDNALELYQQHATSNDRIRIFSCYQVAQKYAWLMKTSVTGFADFIDPDAQKKTSHNRQSSPKVLLPNGAIFILPSNDLTQFYNGSTIPYLMTERDSLDIDTLADFEKALKLLKLL